MRCILSIALCLRGIYSHTHSLVIISSYNDIKWGQRHTRSQAVYIMLDEAHACTYIDRLQKQQLWASPYLTHTYPNTVWESTFTNTFTTTERKMYTVGGKMREVPYI